MKNQKQIQKRREVLGVVLIFTATLMTLYILITNETKTDIQILPKAEAEVIPCDGLLWGDGVCSHLVVDERTQTEKDIEVCQNTPIDQWPAIPWDSVSDEAIQACMIIQAKQKQILVEVPESTPIANSNMEKAIAADILPMVQRLPVDQLSISEEGVELIRSFEGLHLCSYADYKQWSIGYGTASHDGECIDENEANRRFIEAIAAKESYVDKYVIVPLTQGEYDALVSFTYNLGGGNLKKSDLLKMVNAGDYEGASGQFSRWIYAGGKVAGGLVKRREAEKNLFLKR